MQTQIKKWGNSQGIRLTQKLMKSAGIEFGDILRIRVFDGVIVLERTLNKGEEKYDVETGKIKRTVNRDAYT